MCVFTYFSCDEYLFAERRRREREGEREKIVERGSKHKDLVDEKKKLVVVFDMWERTEKHILDKLFTW